MKTKPLGERLRLLEMAEQLAGLGHWRFDLQTKVIGWSAQMYHIHGMAPGDAAPSYESLLARYLPEDAVRLDRLVRQAVVDGDPYSFDGRLVRLDGEIRHVTAKAQCQLDDQGKCVALFGVFQDVTDEIRSKRVTQTLLSRVPALAAYWNIELKCVFANQKYADWFGRTTESMVGLSMEALWGADLFKANRPHVEAVLRGEFQAFERSLVKPTGEFAHMLAQYVPDQDDDGRVHGLFLLVTDFTELKNSESRLASANAELVQARNQAESAARAKSEFLSNMSHELRTPLTSIIGFSDMLVRGEGLDPVAGGHLRRIQDASAALLSTINDILDFSKLEAGQVEVENRPIDPSELARGALELLQPQAGAKGLYRLFEAPALPPLVLGDEVRMRQILLNLLSNAIKFTSEGGVTLRGRYDEATAILRFEVEDTGLGIAPDRLGRLFQRFSQVDASTSRTFGGTGLGLAICRGLAEAMGGTIGVNSIPGQGAVFWFEIPCPIAERPPASQVDDAEFDLAEALPGLRLLVVDDNAANRELARILCEQFGVVVAAASGGAEAVQMAKTELFDVILLDIRMPEVDGPTVAQLVRSNAGPNQATPIIGFTADLAMDFPESWASLFDAWLAKPIVPVDLLTGLAQFSPNLRAPVDFAA